MRPRVYLETTIPSYLTARPSRDLIRAAHQHLTREWWSHRERFDLYVSQIVADECRMGDPSAAALRLDAIREFPLLEQSAEAVELARTLMTRVPLPDRAAVDALHVAIAVVNGMDYLLTWNCTHIANAFFRGRIESACRDHGYEPSMICTPEELLEGDAP